MTRVKPWAVGSFEVIYHPAEHFLKGEDSDRRMALIRELKKDRTIDSEHGMTDIAGISYFTSEILFNIDYQAYKEIGEELFSLQKSDEKNTGDT